MTSSKPTVLFLCNALDSGAALYNIFNKIASSMTCAQGAVYDRMQYIIDAHAGNPPHADVIVHDSTYCGALINNHAKVDVPQVVMFHLIESEKHRLANKLYLEATHPSLVIHTCDEHVRQVEEWGYRTAIIPFTFDVGRFHHLPYPPTFTIGYMGANMSHKGFDYIDRIAHDLHIPCIGARRVSHEGGDWVGREMEFYAQISCYVCAATHESGPLPPIEAMLCGRPVATTAVGMMPSTIPPSAGIVVKDTYDLRASIRTIRANFDAYADGARTFTLPDTSTKYEEAILSCLT